MKNNEDPPLKGWDYLTMNQNEMKRVFFGFEAIAPWPEKLPVGRLLDENHRHMTIAFLGNIPFSKLEPIIENLPKPPHRVGIAGVFDQCLFLPPRHPRVAAWHFNCDAVEWNRITHFHQQFCQPLQELDLLREKELRPLLPHVTLCRAPFDPKQWKKHFQPLPMILKDFHLFESVGDLKYPSIWRHAMKPPFEEIEHTADIAFKIHAETLSQLFRHALTALAFRFPPLILFPEIEWEPTSLDDIVIALNAIVSRADEELGCPFKAVSFHGEIRQEQDNTLTWEMIVDV
jgi:2'-5' RNA ligase